MTPNHHFWTFTPNLFIWNCVNPTLLPSIVSGEYIPQLYGLCTHVHRDSSWFWDVIICRKPKKRHFFHFWWSPGGAIIILQPHKLAFCATGTMVHQNLKRKWGVTMLVSELPRLELAKRGKNGIFAHIPPVHMKVYESNPLALYSIRGNIFLNFMGCTPMYTGIRVDSGTWVSAANPKNVHFFHFWWSPGGSNNNFTTT